MKLKRREYYIIETFSEVEITEEEMILLSNMDENQYDDYTYDLFEDKFKYYTSNGDDLVEYEFKYPEVGEYLGSFDVISDDEVIIDKNINNVSINNIILLDSKSLKTFYWDYTNLKETDIKSFIRENKLNKILDV